MLLLFLCTLNSCGSSCSIVCTGTSAFTTCSGWACGGKCEDTNISDPYTCTSSNCYNNCNFGCKDVCSYSGSSCTTTNCHNSCNEGSCIDLCYKICSSWVENISGCNGCDSTCVSGCLGYCTSSSSCSATG